MGTVRLRYMGDTDIELLAQLSQIALQPDEKVALQHAIDDMLQYFATMSAFTVDSMHVNNPRITKDLQCDIPAQQTAVVVENRASLLAQAPEHESGYIIIPNVL